MLTTDSILNSRLWRSISLVLLMVISSQSSAMYSVSAESDTLSNVLFDTLSDTLFDNTSVKHKAEKSSVDENSKVSYQNTTQHISQYSFQNTSQNTDRCLKVSHSDVCQCSGECCPASIINFAFGKTPPGRNVVQGVQPASYYKIILPAEFKPPIVVLS